MSLLRHGVEQVVALRTDVEVFWVKASWVIALVHDDKSGWNRSVQQLPNKPVYVDRSPTPVHAPVAIPVS